MQRKDGVIEPDDDIYKLFEQYADILENQNEKGLEDPEDDYKKTISSPGQSTQQDSDMDPNDPGAIK